MQPIKHVRVRRRVQSETMPQSKMLVNMSIADDLIKNRLFIPLTKIEDIRMVTD